MLEKILEQIAAYIKAKNFKAALDSLCSTITILFQINKLRLQQYLPNTLNVIVKLLGILDQHFTNPLDKLKYYERTLVLLERFNEQPQKNQEILDMRINLQKSLGELRTRLTITPHKPLPSVPKVPVRFNHAKALSIQTGINHLFQALFTAESNQRSELINDCYRKIEEHFSELFQTIGSYWVRQRDNLIEHLKGNLHTAQRQGLDAFNKTWDETRSHIDNFCILKFFDEARKILCYEVTSDNNRAHDINPDIIFESLFTINQQQLNPSQQKSFTPLMQYMRKSLDALRNKGFNSLIELSLTRVIQINFTDDYKKLIRQILTFITDVQGLHPEGFCILGHGSLAYGIPRDKSDVDYKILDKTKSKIALEYDQDFTFLWRIVMSSFGEDTGNKAGFHLDDKDKTIDKEISGIYTISEFTRYITPDVIAEDVTNLNAAFLFGDEELYNNYQKAIPQLTKEQVRPLLLRTLHDFKALEKTVKTPQNENTRIIDYWKPLIALIIRLALWYGLPKSSSFHPCDVLIWLSEQEILEAEFSYDCINKLNLLYVYQLELECPNKYPAIKTQQTLKSLKHIDLDIIEPLLLKLRTLTATEENICNELSRIATFPNRKKFITELDFNLVKHKPEQLLKFTENFQSTKLRIINCEILNEDKLKKLLKLFPDIEELTLKNISHLGANGKLIDAIIEHCPHLRKLFFENLPDFVLKKPPTLNDQICLIINNCKNVEKALLDSIAKPKDVKFRMGVASFNMDKYADAIAHLNATIQLDPTNDDALAYRGVAKSLLNLKIEALEDFDKAIKINSKNACAHFNRGNILHDLKHLEEARDSIQKACTLNNQNPSYFNNLGLVLYDLEDYSNALAAYISALKITPQDHEMHFNCGLAFYKQGHYGQARDCFSNTLSLNPNFNNARFMLEDCEQRINPSRSNIPDASLSRRNFTG